MITINGASFCHVDSTKQEIHEMEVITDGYHRWHGAIPIFNISETNSKILMYSIGIELLNHIDSLAINITLDPRAWAKKYLIEASVSWFELVNMIKGIKDNRFSSIPAHKNIQFELENTIIVLRSIKEIHIKLNGVYFIKIWQSRTAQFKLEA